MKALTQNDETLLHGRGEVIREIVENCHAERFTVVTAEPGLGVTSLLQAGVAPALRREGFIVAAFSEWQGRFFAVNLKEAIADAVRESADEMFFSEGESLDEIIDHAHARTGRKIVVLLDQFEDYLRCHVNSVISDFFDAELAHAVSDRKGMFVIGLQVHAVPAFDRMQAHIPNLLGFQIRLAPLTTEAARDAVLAEARSMEMQVEPPALELLLSALTITGMLPNAPVATVDGTAPQRTRPTQPAPAHPFFLKLATEQLFEAEARLKSRVLHFVTIEVRGGVDRVVLETFDPAIAELSKTHVDLMFRWCTILISPEKARLSVTEKGLTDYAGRLNRFVPALLQQLVEIRILRTIETPEAMRYEIARECYVPVLHDWWMRREAAIVARRRAVFRITSISVALTAILVMYVVWLIFSPK